MSVAQITSPCKQGAIELKPKVRNVVRKLDIHKIIYIRVMQKVTEGQGVLGNM